MGWGREEAKGLYSFYLRESKCIQQHMLRPKEEEEEKEKEDEEEQKEEEE